jgi:hypothetical protein
MRRLAKTIREDAKYVSERSDFNVEVRSGSSLHEAKFAVAELKERPKVGAKLVKVGAAVLLSPDPFSDVPGGIILATGLTMRRYCDQASMRDIKASLKSMIREFESGSL